MKSLAHAYLVITTCLTPTLAAVNVAEMYETRIEMIEELIEEGQHKRAKNKAVRFEREILDYAGPTSKDPKACHH